jgi:serine protease Do
MKLSSDNDGSSVEGIGFAIPSNEVVSIINQLVKKGKISRPALGLGMADLSSVTTDQQQSVLKLPSNVNKGVVILQVANGSVADNAGLKKYDVITQLGDKKINNTNELRAALYKYKVGDTTKVTFYRNGHQQTATLHLTKEAANTDDNQQEDDGE